MKRQFYLLMISVLMVFWFSTANGQSLQPQVLLRLDDNGMNHSVNKAIEEVAKTGIPFSTSLMFACPWYQEAVDILKKYPFISVGVHLTLNSEWRYYRWGPVLGRTAVPSLCDEVGYFLPSTKEFLASKYKLDEVEKELSAQIERALNSGLKIEYVDYHMGTAVSTPALRAVVERLAKKYKLGISRYLGEEYHTMFDVAAESKQTEFMKLLNSTRKERPTLIVMHVAKGNPEMKALMDMNNPEQYGDSLVARNREAELSVLLSKEFKDAVEKKNFQLITYRDLIQRKGLESMKAP